VFKLEVDRRRVHNGEDEAALGGHEAGAQDHGKHALTGVVASLDDLKKS
jgi:hypothetical protein